MSGWLAALETNSSERNSPRPSAVEDAALVPDSSAVMVLLLLAVLVSDSTLISAFPKASFLLSKSRATP